MLSVGCPGANVCGTLVAAARALRRPRPSVCAVTETRNAAVTHLAARLSWRRALLPAAAPRSECGAALHELARSLAAAGVAVRRAPLSPDELARQPDGQSPSCLRLSVMVGSIMQCRVLFQL